MDSSRLRTGEIVAGGGGIAMFVFLFFDWFGGGAELTGGPGNLSLSHVGISGWDALTDLPGFLIILSAVAGIALTCLAAAGQRVNIPVPRGGVTAGLGSLAVLLILWRMFAGSPTLKIGVFLGLAAAVAITAGALMALAEDGFQPLVAVAGARTAVAAASASPAAPKPPSAAASKPKTRSSGGSRSGGTTTRRRTTTKSGSSNGKRSTTKKSSASKRSSPKKGSARKSSSRSTATKRSSSTRSRSTAAKRAKSTRSTASKKSSSAKSRSSGTKRSSGGRKK